MDAYILIQTWPEEAQIVLDAAVTTPAVLSADMVQGAFDVIVRVPEEDEKEVLIKLLRMDATLRALVCRPRPPAPGDLALTQGSQDRSVFEAAAL